MAKAPTIDQHAADIEYIKKDIAEIKDKLDKKYVSHETFDLSIRSINDAVSWIVKIAIFFCISFTVFCMGTNQMNEHYFVFIIFTTQYFTQCIDNNPIVITSQLKSCFTFTCYYTMPYVVPVTPETLVA